MSKIIKYLIVVGLVGFVSACSSTFKSDVSRFHELPSPKGETVVIVAADPAQTTSLEFASYANIIGNYLAKQGYAPAGEGKPDLIIELNYSVDDGKVMVRSYGSSFAFGYGYGHRFGHHGHFRHFGHLGHFGHFYSPFYGYGYPYYNSVRSYVNYTRKLTMVIRPNVEGEKNLFEGTVESVGRSNDLPQLMPLMVQALFTDFPGVTGSTERVVIELTKD